MALVTAYSVPDRDLGTLIASLAPYCHTSRERRAVPSLIFEHCPLLVAPFHTNAILSLLTNDDLSNAVRTVAAGSRP